MEVQSNNNNAQNIIDSFRQGDNSQGSIEVWINGKLHRVNEPNPQTTLLEYLRNTGLTGTKLGCGEGGCGACTVMISQKDLSTGLPQHVSINACLAPLCSMDRCHVTTVEGIGGIRQGLHPVQRRVAELHGSQCGFCTPGFVMALYTLFRNHPDASPEFIQENMDGNLCRCTGYRPILDAAKSLCCGGGGGGGGCCQDEKKNEDSAEDKTTASSDDTTSEVTRTTSEGLGSMPCFKSGGTEPIFPPALTMVPPYRPLWLSKLGVEWVAPTDLQTLLALKTVYPHAKLIVGNTEVGIETKFKGLKYSMLLNPKAVPELRVLGVEPAAQDGDPGAEELVIGGAVSLKQLEEFAVGFEGEFREEAWRTRGVGAIKHMLRWFASNQIRSGASLAGNLATASPISDMNPMLASLGASLKLASFDSANCDQSPVIRWVKVKDFFKSYRKVDLSPTEIIVSVHVPLPSSKFVFTQPYKQARRREDDISIVSGGFLVELSPNASGDGWSVSRAGAAFGGMGPTTITASKFEQALVGAPWNFELLPKAYNALAEDMPLPDSVPGGQAEYRRALPPSFFFKFFVHTCQQLDIEVVKQASLTSSSPLPPAPTISPREVSASNNFVTAAKPYSEGTGKYRVEKGGLTAAHEGPHQELPKSQLADKIGTTGGPTERGPVGGSYKHMSSEKQVSGAAEYVDDMPHPPGLLHAALVMSPVPHAILKSVDISPALALNESSALDGQIVDVLLASDVQGSNAIGAVIKDEEVFASIGAASLKSVGQIIGVCIATSLAAAKEGAKAVKVEYDELKPVLTIQDAIECGSFYEDLGPPAVTTNHSIASGVLASQGEEGDVVVEGEMKVGGQEHFYLEPNVTMVVPVDDGEELVVYSSTQNPTKTQNFVASATGMAANKVVCRMKRMGGGFGGKETRSVFVALVAAVAVRKHNQPVKICLDRDVDMSITGTRHPFLCKYKAIASKEGKLKSLTAQLYSNGGCSLDLSGPIMDRALFHIDNVYKWPHLSVKGVVCRTHIPSNTAFRGFGGPQAILFTETIMDHLATASGIDPLEFRRNNLYKEGETTHFDQPLVNWNIPRCIDEVFESADVATRLKDIATFNTENRFRKRGLSLVPTKFGISFTAKFMNQGGALVHVHIDGSVLVTHGGTEMGQGLHTKVCQIAARALGVPLSDVHVADTATDKVANSQPSAASQSTDLYGMATLNACEEIRKRLEPVAKAMAQASGSQPTFKDIVTSAYFQRIDLSAHGFYIVPHDRCGFDFNIPIPEGSSNSVRGTPFNYFSQGAAVSEVEVDCLTGDCRILRTDISMDVGSSINPVIDIGQIEGAFVQGWGWLSMEELTFGDRNHKWVRPGHLFTKGPGTYKIPAADDTPVDFRVSLLKNCENPFAVHSSKAIGEPPFCLATSAFLAAKHASDAARAENVAPSSEATTGGGGVVPWCPLDAPATSERLRMRCLDNFTKSAVNGDGGADADFFPQGSW
mmetsp:Transcript_3556/g.4461  ORF Transcript_3556/g.4461 Transcript_3556/m.4461 type:complete len:1478 (+) Transcript_3556:68-4501(+)